MANQKAFYFEQQYCVGCRACEIACKVKNKIDLGVHWRTVHSFETTVNGRQVERFLTHACMHCKEPQCMQACPTNSYTKREDGIVIHNKATCVGCGYCIYACPYKAPQMNPKTQKVEKCHMCYDLQDQGEEPACVRGCPVQVNKIGDLEKLDAKNAAKEAIGFSVFPCGPSMRFSNPRK